LETIESINVRFLLFSKVIFRDSIDHNLFWITTSMVIMVKVIIMKCIIKERSKTCPWQWKRPIKFCNEHCSSYK